MIRLLKFASFLAFAWTLSVYADERPSGVPSEARWVKVDRVTNGDTIVLMDRTRVRLYGIDAPDRDQPYGPIRRGLPSSGGFASLAYKAMCREQLGT